MKFFFSVSAAIAHRCRESVCKNSALAVTIYFYIDKTFENGKSQTELKVEAESVFVVSFNCRVSI